MSTKPKRAKKKSGAALDRNTVRQMVPIDPTRPTRRATSAYMKAFIKRYHDEAVAPLHARVALLETLLAEYSEAHEDRVRLKLEGRVEELERAWWEKARRKLRGEEEHGGEP